jgi:hypothetical protein
LSGVASGRAIRSVAASATNATGATRSTATRGQRCDATGTAVTAVTARGAIASCCTGTRDSCGRIKAKSTVAARTAGATDGRTGSTRATIATDATSRRGVTRATVAANATVATYAGTRAKSGRATGATVAACLTEGNGIATGAAVTSGTADQATDATVTACKARSTIATETATAIATCASTVTAQARGLGAVRNCGVAAIACDTAVPARVTACATIESVTAGTEQCTRVTAGACARTSAGLRGEAESTAGQQAGIGTGSGAVGKKLVSTGRRLRLDLSDELGDASSLRIAGGRK